MANVIRFGTGLVLEYDIDGGPPLAFLTYSAFSGERLITIQARVAEIVVPYRDPDTGLCDFVDCIRRLDRMAGEIQANQSFQGRALPDLPLEYRSQIVPTPEGLSYVLEMGGLERTITWNKTSGEVTLDAGPADEMTFDGFLYYIRTLQDFVEAIRRAVG